MQIKSWDKPAHELHNWIRGMDHNPGAWCKINDQAITLYGSTMWRRPLPRKGIEIDVPGMKRPALVHGEGMILFGADGNMVGCSALILDFGAVMTLR